jgi:hypothetical protein
MVSWNSSGTVSLQVEFLPMHCPDVSDVNRQNIDISYKGSDYANLGHAHPSAVDVNVMVMPIRTFGNGRSHLRQETLWKIEANCMRHRSLSISTSDSHYGEDGIVEWVGSCSEILSKFEALYRFMDFASADLKGITPSRDMRDLSP